MNDRNKNLVFSKDTTPKAGFEMSSADELDESSLVHDIEKENVQDMNVEKSLYKDASPSKSLSESTIQDEKHQENTERVTLSEGKKPLNNDQSEESEQEYLNVMENRPEHDIKDQRRLNETRLNGQDEWQGSEDSKAVVNVPESKSHSEMEIQSQELWQSDPQQESVTTPTKFHDIDTPLEQSGPRLIQSKLLLQEQDIEQNAEGSNPLIESIGFPESNDQISRDLPIPIAEKLDHSPEADVQGIEKLDANAKETNRSGRMLYIPVSNHIRAYHETLHYHTVCKALVCSMIENKLIKSLKITTEDSSSRGKSPSGEFDYDYITSVLDTRKSMLEYSLNMLERKTLLDWTPKHIANQLSLLDTEIMTWIREKDLLAFEANIQSRKQDEPTKHQEHLGLHAHFDFFNFISMFVQKTSEAGPDHPKLISQWIKACMYLWKLNSFNMLKCIVSTLVPITKRYEIISKELETLNKMDYIISEDHNYKKFRKLQVKSKFFIPFLGITIHDLTLSSGVTKSNSKKEIVSRAMVLISKLSVHGKDVDEDFRYWILRGNIETISGKVIEISRPLPEREHQSIVDSCMES